MAVIHDNRGRMVPFFVEDYTYEDITTKNFDPITLKHDATYPVVDLNDSQIGAYVNKGFLVRPDADGLLYGVTWRQYIDNKKILTGLVPRPFLGQANTWIECPFVKVNAANDALYPTACTHINVGRI